jgi:hypothetical protein
MEPFKTDAPLLLTDDPKTQLLQLIFEALKHISAQLSELDSELSKSPVVTERKE